MTQQDIENILNSEVLESLGFDPILDSSEEEQEVEADQWATRMDQARARVERLWD